MLSLTERNERILAALSPKFVDSFWARVHKTDKCWVWTAYRKPLGYGYLHLPRNRGTGMSVLASRVSWLLANGPIPEVTPHVLHSCDNPPCVRPDHLFLGTDSLNHRDMLNKGRESRGEMRNIKLTELDALEIRRLYATRTFLQRELATRFGVSRAMVAHVVHRREWTHI